MLAAPTTDLLILGTDTDAGKTALAILWLAAWPNTYEYWKPLESGDPDSERVGRLVPSVVLHAPVAQFQQPVAPLLAARGEGRTIPPAKEIATAKPRPSVPDRRLLMETFGSPFSPLNETELQIALVQTLAAPALLVSSSAVGAIGRNSAVPRIAPSVRHSTGCGYLDGPGRRICPGTTRAALSRRSRLLPGIPWDMGLRWNCPSRPRADRRSGGDSHLPGRRFHRAIRLEEDRGAVLAPAAFSAWRQDRGAGPPRSARCMASVHVAARPRPAAGGRCRRR